MRGITQRGCHGVPEGRIRLDALRGESATTGADRPSKGDVRRRVEGTLSRRQPSAQAGEGRVGVCRRARQPRFLANRPVQSCSCRLGGLVGRAEALARNLDVRPGLGPACLGRGGVLIVAGYLSAQLDDLGAQTRAPSFQRREVAGGCRRHSRASSNLIDFGGQPLQLGGQALICRSPRPRQLLLRRRGARGQQMPLVDDALPVTLGGLMFGAKPRQ